MLGREHFQRLVARSPELRLTLGDLVDARMQTQQAGESIYSFLFGGPATSVNPAPPEQVRGVPLMHHVPEELRMEAAGLFSLASVPAGQLIFREGEPGDAFYLLASGRVSVTKQFPEGERVLGFLQPGDAFGEIALLANLPRMATLRTTEVSTLLRLGREPFAKFLERMPGVQQHLRELAFARLAANQVATRQ